jgi:hypothetical protein
MATPSNYLKEISEVSLCKLLNFATPLINFVTTNIWLYFLFSFLLNDIPEILADLLRTRGKWVAFHRFPFSMQG